MILHALTLVISATGGAPPAAVSDVRAVRNEPRRSIARRRYCADVPMTDHRGPKRICLTAAKWRKLGVDPVVPKG